MLAGLLRSAQSCCRCYRDMGNTQQEQFPEESYCNLDTHQALAVIQLYLVPFFFLTVLVLGLPLNLLSLWIFSQRLRRWTRSTVFLFNLTLADTSWLLTLPFLVRFHLGRLTWRMGLPLCAAVRMFYHTCFYLSIFFVTCVSLDRYLAIVHPLRSLVLLGRRRTSLVCVAVWTGTVFLSIPVARMTVIQTCPESNRTTCSLYVLLRQTEESLPYSLSCSIFGFFFPMLSISYCGVRSLAALHRRPFRPKPCSKQRRLRRVLSAVVVLFGAFYLPYHLSRNAAITVRALYPNSPASWRRADLAFCMEMCVCSLVACVNPLLSCIMVKQFRKEFYRTLTVMCPGMPLVCQTSKHTKLARPKIFWFS
ncbi:P2Y purinoceptor 6-like [Salarias fasciatus]|uniref:P2Y purinoceptor 6-like n=1 Tax=Salarias fasciatus TaxID=181472 RepID=UPI0011766931|nr:P2Y purinoceptor 6-like [Salarias fasciatus]